jgi:hypothetical protein
VRPENKELSYSRILAAGQIIETPLSHPKESYQNFGRNQHLQMPVFGFGERVTTNTEFRFASGKSVIFFVPKRTNKG